MSEDHIQVSSTPPWVGYEGDGTATEYGVTFPFLTDQDLSVWQNGSLLSAGPDYSVSGAGLSSGGTVTFRLPPPSGAAIVIVRHLEVARTSDFLAGSALRAAALNTELDRLTMVGQELGSADRRSLRIAEHDGDVISVLPAKTARSGRLLSFDQNGEPEAGPLRSIVDNADAIVAAEAGAVAAAASAEASAASAAQDADELRTSTLSVQAGQIRSNHQAAMHYGSPSVPLPYPGVVALAHNRRSRVFAPGSGQVKHHVYRPNDSGCWHINASSSGTLWIDARMLGIGQELRVSVRQGGVGTAVIDGGISQSGEDNLIGPFSAAGQLLIHAGEAVTLTSRSTNANGRTIIDVTDYSANLKVVTLGSGTRLFENPLGLYDGVSIANLPQGLNSIHTPSGYMIDTGDENFSYPDFQSAVSAATGLHQPYIDLPTAIYEISGISAGPYFEIGEEVTTAGKTFEVRLLFADQTRIGLLDKTGGAGVASDSLVGGESGCTATIASRGADIFDLPGGVTSMAVRSAYANIADLRINWHNLEKI
ncbi:hypothetical protein [Minwuia sp.]|uniref:hypothetical protein n=1 Tax=Minwuia sp. TaxID=2493630 RepID=UPI003A9562CD